MTTATTQPYPKPYAVTIDQLGGVGRLATMIGARDFVQDNDGRTIQFGFKGSRKANKVRITLEASDTYTVEFFKYNRRTFECPIVASFEDVHADMLRDVFESTTGLCLSI